MRLATYNLLHGIPVLGAEGLEPQRAGRPVGPPVITSSAPLAEAARLLAADIVGLQEVDVHQERSGGHHQVEVVAEALGAPHWRFVPAVRGTPGREWEDADERDHDGHDASAARPGARYGIGLVSRWPVSEWRATAFEAAPWSLPLLVPDGRRARVMRIPDEPRVALAGTVETPSGPLTVATAHLSFVPGYNVRQLRALRRWLAGMPRPLVLLGDFNLPGSLPRRITGWTSLARVATYPSMRPRVQFDHVLVDGLPRAIVDSARASSLALPVSDHCALAVDIDL